MNIVALCNWNSVRTVFLDSLLNPLHDGRVTACVHI